MRKRSIEILAKLCLTTPKRAIVDALVDAKSLSKREIEQLVDELKRSSEELVPLRHVLGSKSRSMEALLRELSDFSLSKRG